MVTDVTAQSINCLQLVMYRNCLQFNISEMPNSAGWYFDKEWTEEDGRQGNAEGENDNNRVTQGHKLTKAATLDGDQILDKFFY